MPFLKLVAVVPFWNGKVDGSEDRSPNLNKVFAVFDL
jgi:hypothetical protein